MYAYCEGFVTNAERVTLFLRFELSRSTKLFRMKSAFYGFVKISMPISNHCGFRDESTKDQRKFQPNNILKLKNIKFSHNLIQSLNALVFKSPKWRKNHSVSFLKLDTNTSSETNITKYLLGHQGCLQNYGAR